MDTKALRQKILDLAIRGKLVPQDPNDEPASVLLERIRVEKQQMVKEGKLKPKDIKNDTIIFVGEDNFVLSEVQVNKNSTTPYKIFSQTLSHYQDSISTISSSLHPSATQIFANTPTRTSSFLPNFAIAFVLIFASFISSVFIIPRSFNMFHNLS